MGLALVNFITYYWRQCKLEKEAKRYVDTIAFLLGPSLSDISPANQELIGNCIGILKLICKELNDNEVQDYVSKIDYIWNTQKDQLNQVLNKMCAARCEREIAAISKV
jgi:hypothetical protein